ncbi:MAG: AMP-binding protein, partial [Planctomycetota bacterium]
MPTVNIATHLKDMARRRPEQLAVLFPAGRDSAGRTAYTSLTFQRLDEDSDHIAAGLMAMGIGRGVRTVLMVPPSLEFFSLTFALFKAGAVPVFVDPGMGLKNIGTCLAEAQPVGFIGVTRAHVARWLFGWGKGTLTKFVSLRGQRANSISMNKTSMTLRDLTIIGRGICDSPAPRPVDTEGLAPGIYDLETRLQQQIQEQLRDGADSLDLVEAVMEREDEFRMGVSRKKVAIAPPRSRIAETAASDMAAILFTSGSTGVPKGAVYSHGNFVAQVELLKNVFGIEPGEIDLCTFPLFALFASALGMTAIVPRMDFTRPARVNPREVIEPIQRFGATNMFGSPALLNAVGRYASRRIDGLVQETMPTLKRVLSAGAPVSAEIIGRFQATLSAGAQVFTPYGATEALPVAVI